MYCETPVQAQGPALIAQLGGLAREVAFEIPTWQLTIGDALDFGDGRGLIHRTGIDILVHILTNRFDALELETQMRAMEQYQAFQRKSNEDIDTALARWELLKKRASERGQFQMSIPAEADHLLKALRVSPDGVIRLLAPFGNTHPQTQSYLRSMLTSIRRLGRTYERSRGFHGVMTTALMTNEVHTSSAVPSLDGGNSFFMPPASADIPVPGTQALSYAPSTSSIPTTSGALGRESTPVFPALAAQSSLTCDFFTRHYLVAWNSDNSTARYGQQPMPLDASGNVDAQ